MKKSLLIGLVIVVLAFPGIGQEHTKRFRDCHALQSVIFAAGDTILVECDTLYALNTMTFKRYDSAYRDLRRKGSNVSNLMAAYEEILAMQDGRLKTQAHSYEILKSDFDSLSAAAHKAITTSSFRLTEAIRSMENLNRDLVETKSLLGEAKEIIESERQGLNLEKLAWGLGGVVVGVVAGVVIAK